MSVTNEIQAFIVQTLLANAGVTSIVGDRVWDDVPEPPTYPFCALGPSYHSPEDADDLQFREHYVQIDCETRSQGRRDTVNNLTDAVKAALHNATGDLGVHALVDCEVVLVRVLDTPDGGKRGVVQVRLDIEEN